MAKRLGEQDVVVSVIIPVYNAERYVAQAVGSALALPETGEVLLIEDGSPDGALAVCQRLAAEDARVRLLRHPNGENRGAGASRNLGIEAAQCEYVAFLDADDYFLPNRYERALAILESDPSIDGVYEAVGVAFDSPEAEAWWTVHRPDVELTTVSEGIAPEELFERIVGGGYGYFCTDGLIVRRSLFERTGLFPTHLPMAQDTCMWWKMMLAGRLAGGTLDRAVAMRRVHGDNRIIRDAHVHRIYGYLAAREALRWMPKELRTRERVRLIRQRQRSYLYWHVRGTAGTLLRRLGLMRARN